LERTRKLLSPAGNLFDFPEQIISIALITL